VQHAPRTLAEQDAGFGWLGGGLIHVSEDGLSARHLDDTGDEMFGVVVSTSPLSVGRVGLYFEVEVMEVRPDEMLDGLTVGVTATDPSQIGPFPVTAEHVPMTWMVGYDGRMWDATKAELGDVDWDPRCLREGDTVGVLVTLSECELLVFHNGVACCPGPRGIPVHSGPMFAVVDLLGAGRAVRWRVGAKPPVDG